MGKKGKCTGHCPVPCARPWRLAAAGGGRPRPLGTAGGALGPHTERGKERERKRKKRRGKRERREREKGLREGERVLERIRES